MTVIFIEFATLDGIVSDPGGSAGTGSVSTLAAREA